MGTPFFFLSLLYIPVPRTGTPPIPFRVYSKDYRRALNRLWKFCLTSTVNTNQNCTRVVYLLLLVMVKINLNRKFTVFFFTESAPDSLMQIAEQTKGSPLKNNTYNFLHFPLGS